MWKPRGLRNNNPLNIRRSNDKWQGLSAAQEDKEFFQFLCAAYGWRAAFVILTRSYYAKRGINTIEGIISRWAPSNENNTEGYIRRVCECTGISRGQILPSPAERPAPWLMIGYAMAIVENGTTDIPVMDMLAGWNLL